MPDDERTRNFLQLSLVTPAQVGAQWVSRLCLGRSGGDCPPLQQWMAEDYEKDDGHA